MLDWRWMACLPLMQPFRIDEASATLLNEVLPHWEERPVGPHAALLVLAQGGVSTPCSVARLALLLLAVQETE